MQKNIKHYFKKQLENKQKEIKKIRKAFCK